MFTLGSLEDPDTDVVSVMIDFHGEVGGFWSFRTRASQAILLSMMMLDCQTNSTGLFWTMEATIYVQDIWATVSENVMLTSPTQDPEL